MFGAGAVFLEGGAMLSGTVTDMFFKTIFGVLLGEINHIFITSDFGDDTGGRNFFNEKIGFFESGNFIFKWCFGEKINCAVNNYLVKWCFGGEDLFDGATGSEAEGARKSVFV